MKWIKATENDLPIHNNNVLVKCVDPVDPFLTTAMMKDQRFLRRMAAQSTYDYYWLDETPSGDGWVRVEDELPDYEVHVNIWYYPSHPVMEGQILGLSKRIDVPKNSIMGKDSRMMERLNDNNQFAAQGKVTMWRPIPKPSPPTA